MLVLRPPRAAVGRWPRCSRRHRAPLRGQAEQRGELRVCPTIRSEAGRASPPQGVGRQRGAPRAGRRVPGQCAPGRTALALAVGMGALQREGGRQRRFRHRQRSERSFPAGAERSWARVGAEAGPWGETHRGGPGCEEPERILFWQRQPRMLM